MKKQVITNVELIILAHESDVARVSVQGRLNQNEQLSSFTFVETTSRKHTSSRPRLYDGRHVFLTQLEDGRFQLYLKRIVFGSHGINVKAVSREINREIIEAVQVAEDVMNN